MNIFNDSKAMSAIATLRARGHSSSAVHRVMSDMSLHVTSGGVDLDDLTFDEVLDLIPDEERSEKAAADFIRQAPEPWLK